ncbi:MAG: hypothetical protein N2490_00705 [Ignavibacteria bacterium]|nr:hypothetical protein [Ignavibacteria bacterium]
MKNAHFLLFAVFLLSIIMFFSCTKDSEQLKSELIPIEITDIKESPNDLLSVDFQFFYKELSSAGEWIEIDAKKLGINLNTTTSENSLGNFLSDILGVKYAYAQTGEQIFNLFVWRPSNELVGDMMKETKEYIPFNNGQWVYTDEGWYFKANTSQEELTSHYGRWTQDEELGWVWLPGKTYSPAWVDWRQNDDYVAWAPIPPGKYIENESIKIEDVSENKYTIVEKKHLIEPSVYKYRYQYVENKNKIMIKEMTKTDGLIVKDKKVINKGPDITEIEKKTGKKIEQVKINKVNKKEESGLKGNSLNVFTPELKKSREVRKEPISKPEKLVSYKDAKKITKEEKEKLKAEEKIEKKEEKETKKQEKLEDKQLKKEQKKEEKEIKNKEKQETKEMKKEEKSKKKEDKQVKEKGKEKRDDDKTKGKKDDDKKKNKKN